MTCATTLMTIADDSFFRIASVVASPVFAERDSAAPAFTDSAVMLRQEMAYQVLRDTRCQDRRLEQIRVELLKNYSACNDSLRNLRNLGAQVPDLEGIATKALAASPALYRAARANYDNESAVYTPSEEKSLNDLAGKAVVEILKAGFNVYESSNERASYRKSYRAARIRALDLETDAKAHYSSGPLTKYRMGFRTDFAAADKSAVVRVVEANSPAARAGLQVGDTLLSANGQAINESNYAALFDLGDRPGKKFALRIKRGSSTRELKISADMPIGIALLHTNLNGSFDGFYASDYSYVTNSSGKDLTNVLFFVDIIGRHGDDAQESTDKHMHFVSHWPAGATKVMRYMSTAVDGIASDESVDHIDRLKFRIYSDQHCQAEVYEYSGDEYNQDVKAYMSDKELTGSWFSYSDDNLFFNSGVKIKSKDGSSFPATGMTLTVHTDSDTHRYQYKFSGDVFDGEEYFSSKAFNGMSVKRIEVNFQLPYSNETFDRVMEF